MNSNPPGNKFDAGFQPAVAPLGLPGRRDTLTRCDGAAARRERELQGSTSPVFQIANRKSQIADGFTLIEVMVAVLLLSVIILGLVAMFDQTRRAFTLGLGRSDFEESGRVAMDMIGREIEQMTPTGYTNCANFYVDLPLTPLTTPVLWPLAGPGDYLTNRLQRLYFVTKYNQQWNVIGYRVDPAGVSNGVGTLYRYSANNVPLNQINSLIDVFTNDIYFATNPPLPFNRIIDGVVNFRVRAYDANGVRVENNPKIYIPNVFTNYPPFFVASDRDEYPYGFYSKAVPAYVEVELAVLEARTLEHWRALSNNPTLAGGYLTNHAGQVHVFRQRIPVRAVDLTAYP